MKLSLKIGAEIVSADSGQVYRGLDIGTAKPAAEERRDVSFHLIDVTDPDRQFSAADFCSLAEEAIQDIQSRGRRVLVCGGTGLYLKTLEGGLFEGPPRDAAIRRELENQVSGRGVESLHGDLQKIDPEAAKTIPAQNRQRLIRALEVFRITGRPISEFWKEHAFRERRYVFDKIGLMPPSKEELHRRIDERVDRMIEKGLVEETERLLGKWGEGAPGLKIIGYKEIAEYLGGRLSLAEAILRIKRNTRQYAKRQLTWFKKDRETQWTAGELVNLQKKIEELADKS